MTPSSDDADWVDRAQAVDVAESPPVSFDRNGTVIVAGTDSAIAADIALQLGIGTASNPTCLVATQVPPAKLDPYVTERAPTRPPLGYVDATDDRPSPAISAAVQAIENIPSAHDLLQLTTAISDVLETIAPPDQATNIVVPVFDSFLGVAPTDRVVRVLSHLAESTEADGRVVVGLNYANGSTDTLQSLTEHSDAVLWVEQTADGDVALDVEQVRQ
ncbi:hypothetical protein ACKVMT_07750 [Halobacteriales archaeon Cl-PHB]